MKPYLLLRDGRRGIWPGLPGRGRVRGWAGDGRAGREVVQVRLGLPGAVYRELEGRAALERVPMWELVARLVVTGGGAAQLEAGGGGATPEAMPCPVSEAMVLAETGRLGPMGLCFVPDLVLALLRHGTLPQVHAALGAAARARVVELRPEDGLRRLSAQEAALCLEGFKGARLCWARRCGG